jgi:hypothetical protein
MYMGGRFERAITDGSNGAPASAQVATFEIFVGGTKNDVPSNMAFFHINDESQFWATEIPCGSGSGCLIGSSNGTDGKSGMFRQRIKQSNTAVLRDLDWNAANVNNCTTWSSRRPITYYSYNSGNPELRNAASGYETYIAGGHTYTVPKIGQYVNARGTGASGGTISYNSGTDTYSVTLGSGSPVDKQTFTALIPSNGTGSSKINLNATGALTITRIGAGAPAPVSGALISFTFDAVLNTWVDSGVSGVQCGAPQEVFIEVNAELGTTAWHVLPYMGLDPMTDWVRQFATYIKTNYPSMKPFFEVTNEPFNCVTANPQYESLKSQAYIAQDAAWTNGNSFCGTGGDTYGEIGKMASTTGQDLVAVGINYELAVPIQTCCATSAQHVLTSAPYVNQTIAPTQTGYSKTAAYLYATRISMNNYWSPGDFNTACCGSPTYPGIEVGKAYCYYNYSISMPCQSAWGSQAAVMTSYVNSILAQLPAQTANYTGGQTLASTCGTGTSRPAGCTLNVSAPLAMYEGGMAINPPTGDVTDSVISATNASTAVLAVTNNGCVAGETVSLSSLSGGAWSTAAGNYTVQASGTDANHCAINLNSTGLGTLSSATLTYVNSGIALQMFRNIAYIAPEVNNVTTQVYNMVVTNGGMNPSQYFLSSFDLLAGGEWYAMANDVFQYFTAGSCTSCATTNTPSAKLTLGGMIKGQFRIGDTLLGAGVAGIGTGVGSMTTITSCTPVGSNVCGTTSGDTLGLSQSVVRIQKGNAFSSNYSGPSPVWPSICAWNGGSC